MILVVSILASALTIWSFVTIVIIEKRVKRRQEWILSVLQEHEARRALSKVHTAPSRIHFIPA